MLLPAISLQFTLQRALLNQKLAIDHASPSASEVGNKAFCVGVLRYEA